MPNLVQSSIEAPAALVQINGSHLSVTRSEKQTESTSTMITLGQVSKETMSLKECCCSTTSTTISPLVKNGRLTATGMDGARFGMTAVGTIVMEADASAMTTTSLMFLTSEV